MPFLGVFALAAALVFVACLLANHDPSPAELRISAILVSAAVLANLALGVARHGWLEAVRPVHVVSVGVVYWILLDVVQMLYDPEEPTQIILEVFLCVAVFSATLQLAGDGPLRRIASQAGRHDCSINRVFAAGIACFGIGTIYYLFRAQGNVGVVLDGVLRGRGATAWSRGAYGDSWAAFEFVTYFLFLMPSLFVLSIRTAPSRFDPRVIVIAVLSALALLEIGSQGSRRDVGLSLAATLPLLLLTSKGSRSGRRVSLQTLALVPVLLLGMSLSLNLLLATRGDWLNTNVTAEQLGSVRVDDNFLRLCQTIEAVPQYAPYAGFQPVYFALVRPIPRALWPGKPTDPGFTVHNYLGIGSQVSLSNSVIGELYSSFGLPAVALGGVVYGLLIRLWERKVNPWSGSAIALVYCVGCGTLFNGVRSMNDLVLYSYPTMAAFMLAPLVTAKRKRRKSPAMGAA